MKTNMTSMLLSGALLLSASPALGQDCVVKLTTARPAGEHLSFKVNHCKTLTVDWGDGNPVEYQTTRDDFYFTVEGELKGSVVTVTGNKSLTALHCSDAELTDIDLSGATNLTSLYLRGNQIDTLDLRGMTKLIDLYAADNQIKVVRLSGTADNASQDLASIQTINLANNHLTGMYYLRLPTLSHLDISGNEYTSFYSYDAELTSLKAGGNKITGTINLTKCPKIEMVSCEDNNLKTLSMIAGAPTLRQLFANGNQLKSIDLEQATELTDLHCQDNGLSQLKYNAKAPVSTMNVSGNALTFAVLPPANLVPDYLSFMPQNAFDVSNVEGMKKKEGVPYVDIAPSWSERLNTAIDLRDFCSLSNGRYDAEYQCFAINPDGTETELIKRSSSTEEGDYSVGSGKFSFFTPQKKVYIQLTSKTYGFTINSTPFVVGDDITSVSTIVNNGNELNVRISGQSIVLNSPQSTEVSIYTLDGKKAWQGNVSGERIVNLPKGVYLVAGKKVIL